MIIVSLIFSLWLILIVAYKCIEYKNVQIETEIRQTAIIQEMLEENSEWKNEFIPFVESELNILGIIIED